jgi:hypothetical protein
MSRGRVVLAGSLAQRPGWGGHTWVFLQYLLGFRRLGFDVLLLDRLTREMGVGIAGTQYSATVMERFGMASDYCVLDSSGESIAGIRRSEALKRSKDSILLINVNGFLDDEELFAAAPVRVYLDIDPGFGQMWRELHLHDPFAGHDAFVTIAENIGRPGCSIPTCGLDWIATRQPVVLDLWPAQSGNGRAFTSIGTWRGPFAPIEFEGKTYGLRAHEFRKFVELPRLTGEEFELALDIHDADVADVELLRRESWRLVPPQTVAASPTAYRDFIGRSRAEFMVAKNMYVETRGGWFSDRSVCYLASGRPVIAEDTGLAGLYPIGDGLLVFTTLDDAVAAVQVVAADYSRHAKAAREIAESEFGSDRILSALIDRLSP